MDSRQLRDATRAEHEATEALMPLGGADLTRDLYCRVLEVLLPLVKGWEQWAESAGPEDLREMLVQRRRSQLLVADLEVMGGGRSANLAAETPVAWEAVLFAPRGDGTGDGNGPVHRQDRRAAFLGAMYVMEGSTLGGRFVARHVESVLGLAPGEGDAYFQGHGEATGSLWREVTGKIAEVPEELAPVVIEAARRTFQAFGDALRTGLAASETVQC